MHPNWSLAQRHCNIEWWNLKFTLQFRCIHFGWFDRPEGVQLCNWLNSLSPTVYRSTFDSSIHISAVGNRHISLLFHSIKSKCGKCFHFEPIQIIHLNSIVQIVILLLLLLFSNQSLLFHKQIAVWLRCIQFEWKQ